MCHSKYNCEPGSIQDIHVRLQTFVVYTVVGDRHRVILYYTGLLYINLFIITPFNRTLHMIPNEKVIIAALVVKSCSSCL